jgi:hypothetical protein
MKRARAKTAMVVVLLGLSVAGSPARAVGQCCGDCSGDGAVALAARLRVGDAWSTLSSYGSHCHAGECRERA